MPPKYGSYKTTVWERHKKKWSERGVWKHIMDSLVSYGYHQKGIINVNDLSIDSSTITAKKGRGHCKEREGQEEIGYYDGYNKKAKGSKVHALVTPQSLPVTIDRPWTW